MKLGGCRLTLSGKCFMSLGAQVLQLLQGCTSPERRDIRQKLLQCSCMVHRGLPVVYIQNAALYAIHVLQGGIACDGIINFRPEDAKIPQKVCRTRPAAKLRYVGR